MSTIQNKDRIKALVPQKYRWLLEQPVPLMVQRAMELYGTKEIVGKQHSKVIMDWADEIGGKVEQVYYADEVPWCGLFIAVVAQRAKKTVVKDPLWALNWGTFGKFVKQPGLGDVLTFKRNSGGHVGLYVGEDATAYHVLGGNQSNEVNITRILKSRLYVARRPDYNIQPASVRPIKMAANGPISNNEA